MKKQIILVGAAFAMLGGSVSAAANHLSSRVYKRTKVIKKVTTVTTTKTWPAPRPMVQTVPDYYPVQQPPVIRTVPVVYTQTVYRPVYQPVPVTLVPRLSYGPIWRTSIGPAFSGGFYHLSGLRYRNWGMRGFKGHHRRKHR